MKNPGDQTKSRLGFCRKKFGFDYRNIVKNHGVETKSRFDFHEKKLQGWNEK